MPGARGTFVRLRAAGESSADSGSRGPGDGGRDRDGRDVGEEGADDEVAAPRPLVVRFVDGVELHVEGRRLGEVLTQLRAGTAERGRA